MKNMAEMGKIAVKKQVFGVKSEYLGLRNYEPLAKLERLNGAKCGPFS